jgi:hypothetical protein
MINAIQVTPIPSYSYALLTPYGALSLDPTTLNLIIGTFLTLCVIFGIIYLLYKTNAVSKIWSWQQKTQTPLWFIIAASVSLFPISICIVFMPMTMFEIVYSQNITLPDWSYVIIGNGFKLLLLSDILLAVWAYFTWKWDHFIPWMQRKTKKVSRNKHGQIDEL